MGKSLVVFGIALVAAISPSLASGAPPAPSPVAGAEAADPFLWLEDTQSAKALAWVATENARTEAVLKADPRFQANEDALTKMAAPGGYVPAPGLLGGGVSVFKANPAHPPGLLQWTSLADYRGARPRWRTLIDVGALDAAEGANWIISSIDCPPFNADRCLVTLSAGGTDAAELREFDLKAGDFVPAGFRLPRGKQIAGWIDPDTLIVGRDWGPGTTTTAGYPFVIKAMKRGQDISQAHEVFRGDQADANVWPYVLVDGEGHRAVLIQRARDNQHTETYQLTPGGVVRLAVPPRATLRGLIGGKLIFTLEQDWRFHGQAMASGALVAAPLAWLSKLDAPAAPGDPSLVVFQPGPRQSIEDAAILRDRIAVTFYDNVRGRLAVFADQGAKGWTTSSVTVPDNAAVSIYTSGPGGTGSLPNVDLWTTSRSDSDTLFYRVSGFLTPMSFWQLDAATGATQILAAEPDSFDASGEATEQFEATAPDGTRIPYFVVHPKAMKLDGSNPTIEFAYGGWGFIMAPTYDPMIGKLWLDRGGVYVLANIRGGGEFGPAWHEAALKANRQLVYDDFTAVARDLIARKITSPEHLGALGASNGGLVAATSMVQHPELWNAAVIEKPILDLERYEKIAAGAAGVGEYGSMTQPDERAVLTATSPYRNLKPGVRYPEPLLITNTLDDRAGPAHARKFAARLSAFGSPFLFYEVGEGGHAGSTGATAGQQALTGALEMTYFMRRLMN